MYEKQILTILLDVGARGISAKKLAKHVYNHCCTLFFQPDFEQVYRYVKYYLLSRSRQPKGIIEHTDKWGHHRLNTRSKATRQLLLEHEIIRVENNEAEEEKEKNAPDLSLSLFS